MENNISFENLTAEETKFIVFALKNIVWESDEKLRGFRLGDMERGMVEKNKKDANELLCKIRA